MKGFADYMGEALSDMESAEPERTPRYPDRVRTDGPAPPVRPSGPNVSEGRTKTERRYEKWQARLKGYGHLV